MNVTWGQVGEIPMMRDERFLTLHGASREPLTAIAVSLGVRQWNGATHPGVNLARMTEGPFGRVAALDSHRKTFRCIGYGTKFGGSSRYNSWILFRSLCGHASQPKGLAVRTMRKA
jgi:hypothetical protein